uniref:Uncharacterized protein n=1 Tax=Podarcis muralis TaxID=64176 RepID=A0A670J114_PODMU
MAAAGVPVEVALVSAAEAALSSGGGSSVWEVGSGASVAGYRGFSCAARGMALVGGEHLLGAQLGKACVGTWELQRKEGSPAPGRDPPPPWGNSPWILRIFALGYPKLTIKSHIISVATA